MDNDKAGKAPAVIEDDDDDYSYCDEDDDEAEPADKPDIPSAKASKEQGKADIPSAKASKEQGKADIPSAKASMEQGKAEITDVKGANLKQAQVGSIAGSVIDGGEQNKGSKDEDESWKEEIRAALRESQQSISRPPREDEDKYYRIVVKVPRVTKSYYDELRDGDGGDKKMKSHSDSALHKKHRVSGRGTFQNDPCIPNEKLNKRGPKVAPTQAKLSLANKPNVPSKVKANLPHVSKSKHTIEREDEILSYFDPEMVQPAFQQLLKKSRNIVVGPPKQILREYFGYSKDDPIPEELRYDDAPKAFILPKNMWKPYNDIEASQKEKQEKANQKLQSRLSVFSTAIKNAGEGPTTTPSKPVVERKKKKKSNDVLETESKQNQLLDEKKDPLDFFKQPVRKVHPRPDNSAPSIADPNSYERVKTKCERKKRRESSFDEDVRERESEYAVICGSGSSSDTLSFGKSMASLHTSKPRLTSAAPNYSRAQTPSMSMGTKENPIKRSPSAFEDSANRDGSNLSIELGPDPMRRLPRDDSDLKYYRSHPMYPTLSNETLYEWYRELNRLDDLRRRHSSGDGLDDPCVPRTGKNKPWMNGRPRSFLPPSHHDKPERADYDTKDYVYDNARSITIMPPKNPIPRYVDDRHGTTHLLEPSGLLHKYIHRDDFGQLPNYLMYRNEELGRPAVPNFNKFYQFHKCKYVNGHIHSKCCNRIYPTRGGCGDWVCDMVMPDDYGGGVKTTASHSHSRLEESYRHGHPPRRRSSQLGREGEDDVDPDMVQYVVNKISKLLAQQSLPYCTSSSENPSSTTNYCTSTNANFDPSNTTNYCSTTTANFDPSGTTNYCPSNITGHLSASKAGQSDKNFFLVATHPTSRANMESACMTSAASGTTGSFSFIPVPPNL